MNRIESASVNWSSVDENIFFSRFLKMADSAACLCGGGKSERETLNLADFATL